MRMRCLATMAVILLLSSMVACSIAESSSPNSQAFTLTTDKSTYASGDEILVTASLKNENPYPVRNALIQLEVPHGFIVKKGYSSSISAESVGNTPLVLATRLIAFSMPKTGDEWPLSMLLGIFLISVLYLLVTGIRKKRTARSFSLLLCLVVGAGFLPSAIPEAVATGSQPFLLTAKQPVNYDKHSFSIEATASYNLTESYRVIFNPNDPSFTGEMPFINVPAGSKLVRPQPDPTRAGHVFTGWYVNPSCTEMFLFNDEQILQDATLYAGWIPLNNDQRILDTAYALLQIGYAEGNNSECVTEDVYLPLNVEVQGAVVSVQWHSDIEKVLSSAGVVLRPSTDQHVHLTATISYAGLSIEKVFKLRVCQENTVNTAMIPEPTLAQIAEQSAVDIEIDFTDYGTLRWLNGEFYTQPISSPDDAIVSLYSIKTLLGMDDPKQEMAPEISNISDIGSTFRLKQMYQRVPVYGRSVIVSTDNGGYTVAVQSNYLDHIDLTITPGLSITQAAGHIVSGYAAPQIVGDIVLAVYSLDEYLMSPILVYYADVVFDGGSDRVFIDANSGVVIKSYSTIISLTGSGKDEFGIKKSFPVSYKFYDLMFYMEDTNRKIAMLSSKRLIPEIFNIINSWGEYATAISAYSNTIRVIDWWNSTHNRASYDNKDGKLNVYVDVIGKNEKDELQYDNASWISSMKTIRFLQKNEYSYTTGAALDVVAHEFAHAVFDYHAGETEYAGISGAIDEAYADIFAIFMEPNWTIGEILNPDNVIRHIENPLFSNNPSYVNGNYYVDPSQPPTEENDYSGVHKNSTVISHAMYLMNKNGMSLNRLNKLWYASMGEGYKNEAEWLDVRRNVLLAARKLSYSSDDTSIIKSAFDSVGITDGNDYLPNWPSHWPMAITGANIGLRLALDRLSVKSGNKITATWTINKGTPPYQVDRVLWVLIDQDNQIITQYDAKVTYLGNNRWTSSFYPPNVYSGSCAVYMKDSAGKQDGVALRYLIQP